MVGISTVLNFGIELQSVVGNLKAEVAIADVTQLPCVFVALHLKCFIFPRAIDSVCTVLPLSNVQ